MTRSLTAAALVVALAAAACGDAGEDGPPTTDVFATVATTSPPLLPPTSAVTATPAPPTATSAAPPSTAPTTSTSVPATTTTTTPPTSTTAAGPSPVVIRLALDRRVNDADTAGFEEFVRSVLGDSRGWARAAFIFTYDDPEYTVVLAEPDVVDSLCLPYQVGGLYSCQIGPTVALNADRWRFATDTWPGTLDEYRTMLVNHEVGHLLGQHHPREKCTAAGDPAAVMAQQSKSVDSCLPNPWPLQWEIDCALRRLEPLAPGFEASATPLCGPNG